MFSIFGYIGQRIYNNLDDQPNSSIEANTASSLPTQGFLASLADMKYSPVRIMPDAEYEALLRQKMLHVDAALALVEEQITAVKAMEDSERGTGAAIDKGTTK